jgi:hypothetical protein
LKLGVGGLFGHSFHGCLAQRHLAFGIWHFHCGAESAQDQVNNDRIELHPGILMEELIGLERT